MLGNRRLVLLLGGSDIHVDSRLILVLIKSVGAARNLEELLLGDLLVGLSGAGPVAEADKFVSSLTLLNSLPRLPLISRSHIVVHQSHVLLQRSELSLLQVLLRCLMHWLVVEDDVFDLLVIELLVWFPNHPIELFRVKSIPDEIFEFIG